MNTILVIEDDPSIRELLAFNLEREGFQVKLVSDGQEGLEMIKKNCPDLLILDLMLPFMDGMQICRNLRKDQKLAHLPIIMLTAKVEEIDKVLGLEMGADDYVTKPFSIRELISRVKALIRRSSSSTITKKENILVRSFLKIDLERYKVYVKDKKIDLTYKEFRLLSLLAENPGKVFTREYILEYIWGYEYLGDTRTVDVHIRHIRKKIGENLLETVRGVGYKYKE
ncbi:two-component system, OmpR family, alkaline phosphatase synthesis response regulator PhoP [Desulfonispora thiosulfatigenes DSM 11270]|uniref:Stage 0 sporulation protein A homolog n=1 Tax=Desulfonispora thiosulfatigenes DSM 11270 TaxID=656914 RepID=A0A1W1VFU9_DESTI|nr:response regulator transcription factor [Desulfonispora thiosulfatigenes]SMB92186.1 two-component system, OmpR family, alkaline phosphatase synthesis response regulator PhoP [Desulfonispora thiosulfatigenes DSM 11270]